MFFSKIFQPYVNSKHSNNIQSFVHTFFGAESIFYETILIKF